MTAERCSSPGSSAHRQGRTAFSRRVSEAPHGIGSDVQQWLATLLVGIPKVRHDSDLVTLLANLPQAGGPPYITVPPRSRPMVLANANVGDNYDIMLAATRRLPQDALKSRERPNNPLH
jgi:hypothetical protein